MTRKELLGFKVLAELGLDDLPGREVLDEYGRWCAGFRIRPPRGGTAFDGGNTSAQSGELVLRVEHGKQELRCLFASIAGPHYAVNMGFLEDQSGPKQSKSAKGFDLSSLLPFTTVALVIAAFYVGWTFYSRWQRAKDAQAVEERKRAQSIQRSKQLLFGNGEVKFTIFSASPGHLKPGQSAQLCYGVLNAVKVQIDPPVGEEVKPTVRHCLDIAPKKTTTYTIKASNDKGQEGSTSLTVHVE
jgi:hypothetical protein